MIVSSGAELTSSDVLLTELGGGGEFVLVAAYNLAVDQAE